MGSKKFEGSGVSGAAVLGFYGPLGDRGPCRLHIYVYTYIYI